jgi:phosphopantothenoylcysteine decarboxylase/phosphopantothenate--cysteine ligase
MLVALRRQHDAKIAHGLADNFLTTLILALRCPLVLAPTMDVDMYRNENTRHNIALLREQGCEIIEPESGELASGLSGPGRLPETAALLERLARVIHGSGKDLQGRRVLVTAGPTHEPIDPVRFIGNRSSGKMGYALAAAAAQRGAEVTLISGPVALATPRNVRRIDVQTAAEMEAAVMAEFPSTDCLVMAAAVADFAPAAPSGRKLKRDQIAGETFALELRRNPDILKAAGAMKKDQIVVGFALETEDGVENASAKLAAKRADAIVLNSAAEEGAGIGSDTNIVTIITAGGETERLPRLPKIDVAHAILQRIAPMLSRSRHA